MTTERPCHVTGALCGISAAILFGASAPIAKILLPSTGPLVLAGLLYLGAGLGLTLFGLVRSAPRREAEAKLKGRDLLLVAGLTVSGGVAGPVLLLLGLERVSGLAGSLLLNLEAPFTILLAVALFREHLTRRAGLAAGAIVLGGILLSWDPGELRADPWGAVAIAAACFCWALDNNLTQRLSLRDPVAVVRWKTLGAGVCTASLGQLFRDELPGHHQHAHEGAFEEPHSHAHRHEAIGHDHPHVPEVHHRHRH
jgi:drug/metabolite transporter (DMT)-like permease